MVEYKFHEAVDEIGDKSRRPLMFLVPGLTGDRLRLYVANIMNEAYDAGFDVVLVNHRGLGGAELKTPKLYSAFSHDDCADVIEQIGKNIPNEKAIRDWSVARRQHIDQHAWLSRRQVLTNSCCGLRTSHLV